ncbi:hypothetical protein [Streptomyces lincolnensis]|uniref:hypothetical protein n=1 Tax=Streptomyces lincolnensis TaxID=1915 RepID=UPI000831F3F8|nr:hypothetical protein [Streptomyces lincolnensis]QMV07904.1 hypothetical protein GJU35_21020 [Streptomyces lincolnensis]
MCRRHLTSVLFVTLPSAAIAAVATAIGPALRARKVTHTETHHHYTGPDRRETNQITAPAYGVSARTEGSVILTARARGLPGPLPDR